MEDLGVILLCFSVGFVLLVAELFVPSHGLLTLGALTCFGIALFHVFAHSTAAGIVGVIGCLVLVPTVLLLGLKYVQHLPMANKLAPTAESTEDTQYDRTAAELRALIGQSGVVRTPLHPVGMCEFEGRRIPCVAESGMIDVGEHVVGVGVRMQNLAVRTQAPDTSALQNSSEA